MLIVVNESILKEYYFMKNKYKIVSKGLFYCSIIMMIIIVIHLVIEYQHYLQHPEYSAPFLVYIGFKIITYAISIVVGFALSFIFKYKGIRNN